MSLNSGDLWTETEREPRSPEEVVQVLVREGRESFGGGGFTATSGGNRGLVVPGRRRTQVRELQVPGGDRIWGHDRSCSLTASGWLRSKRCSLPTGKEEKVCSPPLLFSKLLWV